MQLSQIVPAVALVALLACDSGKPDADATAKADAKATANAGVAVDAKAGAAVAGAVEVPTPTAEVAAEVAGGAAAQLRPVAEVEAALGTKIVVKAADLDLAGIGKLVAKGEVKAAAELELLLNAPGTASHHVDLDVDGKLDYVQVVEVRAGAAVSFELRAVPSSKLDASLAVLLGTISLTRAEAEGKAVVAASYGAAVSGGADFKFSEAVALDLKADGAVAAEASTGAFVVWAFTVGRPVYVSTHVTSADISLAADGGAQFTGDAAVRLEAARLAALRASLELDAAAIAAPKLSAGAKVGAGAKASHGVKVEHSASASHSAKVEGGGFKVGGSVKVGGGVSLGGGGKAGGGIKIGK